MYLNSKHKHEKHPGVCTLLFSFADILCFAGNRQTLIHYSYSNILTDLRLAPDTGAYTVVIAIHVCKQTGTCAVRTLSATVIDTNDDVALAEIIEANVQVQNYQTLMALLASDSSKRFVTKPLVSTRNMFFIH